MAEQISAQPRSSSCIRSFLKIAIEFEIVRNEQNSELQWPKFAVDQNITRVGSKFFRHLKFSAFRRSSDEPSNCCGP